MVDVDEVVKESGEPAMGRALNWCAVIGCRKSELGCGQVISLVIPKFRGTLSWRWKS